MRDFLRKIPLFTDLPEADLGHLCDVAEEMRLPAKSELFTEGSPGDRMYVVQEGELEILKASGGRQILLSVREPGDVIGETALFEQKPRMATVRARTDSVLIVVTREQLDHLLVCSPSAASTLFYTVLRRWRETEAMLRQSEKMAQLGTLSAGVAHELNNPAAAVKRGAGQLLDAVGQWEVAQAALDRWDLLPNQEATLSELTARARTLASHPPTMDGLARSDLEEAIETWLRQQGIPDAVELAPELVNLEYDVKELDVLAGHFSDRLPAVVRYLDAVYTVHNLLAEIGQGASRISEIVKALKSYSYLDRAPVQLVDIHEGLDNTLLILQHKLRSGIDVRREYASQPLKIQGHGSELNQVWTNILDNAADALNGHGQIIIRTRREGDWVVVEIEDNGPGIPAEVLPRVFDPFFTTKPPGEGTGLGLDITYNIVVNKHRGDIKVASEPGRTCFQVWLPLNFETVNEKKENNGV
jgi:signal transduction histidine kinase